jgi:hypothetical protein
MWDWICCASSWKKVLVVRPHPGHATTIGVNERSPIVTVGLGRQRHAYRVANALLQKHGHTCSRSDNTLRAHAGFRETEMKRVFTARSQSGVDRDEILNAADLRGQDDSVVTHSDLFRAQGTVDCRGHYGVAHHFLRCQWFGA